jgi:hypothetical protein
MSVTDAEVLGEELEPVPPMPGLFTRTDPQAVLEDAARVATALTGALEAGGMIVPIGNRKHVMVDGWQTAGALVGITAVIEWSRLLADGSWEARAVAKTSDGRIVGAGESMCSKEERHWRTSEEFARRSMAQTRAIGRALRGPCGFLVQPGSSR